MLPYALGNFNKSSLTLGAFLLGLLLIMFPTQLNAQTTFTSSGGVTVTGATGNPYPLPINVSGLTGVVSKVTVTLNDINHSYVDDLDILLVAPDGKNVIILSDAGEPNAAVNLDLNFDDAAGGFVPDITPAPANNGFYKPTNYAGEPDVFPAPAPATQTGTTLAAFNGINPNGTWQLYVTDDFTISDTGSIASYSLTITTMPALPSAASATLSGQVVTAKDRGIYGARLTVQNSTTLEVKSVTTNPLGYFNIADLPVGSFYIINVEHKRYVFPDNNQGLQLTGDGEIKFVGEPRN